MLPSLRDVTCCQRATIRLLQHVLLCVVSLVLQSEWRGVSHLKGHLTPGISEDKRDYHSRLGSACSYRVKLADHSESPRVRTQSACGS